MTQERSFRAYLAWLSICIIWGTTYLAIRVGVKNLPPILFAGLRWIIAGPILYLFLRWRGYELPKKSDLTHLAIVAIALLGVGNGLVAFGEQFVPSGLTAILITTEPFWIVCLETFLPHGKKINIKVA
ncbi:MAG: EamA family transporter, partial [Bacteroidota bacterium]